MTYQNILFEKHKHIAVITINRPSAMNAINRSTWIEIGTALEAFKMDDSLWVAVITGAGERAFCAGADLKAIAAGEGIIPDVGKEWGFAGIVQHYVNKPIIAAVNGFALGGGTEIALACDLIVSSEQASFGLPEVKRGIIAGAGGLLRLPRQIPLKVAAEMIFLGDSLTAEEAKRWGLVNKVVPHEQVLVAAIELAERICQNAPIAVRASKEIMYRGLDAPLDHPQEAWAVNAQYVEDVMASEDSKEGPQAFAEKREPVWLGK